MNHLPVWLRPIVALPIRGIPVRIRGGPNRGLYWSLAAALGRQYLSGGYHRLRIELLDRLIVRGDCFWDGGAHQGYVTLLAAQRVGPTGQVFAFEPSADNRWYLQTHVRWGRFLNVTIRGDALSAADGEARFGARSWLTGSVAFNLGSGTDSVTVRSVDSLLDSGLQPPTFLKLDVEGAEADVIRGGSRAMRHVEVAVVSIHSLQLYHQCVPLLVDAGLTVYIADRISRFLLGEERWRGDPDIVAVRPWCAERVRAVEGLERFSLLRA